MFKDGQLYATVAIVVAIIQVVFVQAAGLRGNTGTAVAIVVGVLLTSRRLLARLAAAHGLDLEPSKIMQRVAKPRATDNPPGQ